MPNRINHFIPREPGISHCPNGIPLAQHLIKWLRENPLINEFKMYFHKYNSPQNKTVIILQKAREKLPVPDMLLSKNNLFKVVKKEVILKTLND